MPSVGIFTIHICMCVCQCVSVLLQKRLQTFPLVILSAHMCTYLYQTDKMMIVGKVTQKSVLYSLVQWLSRQRSYKLRRYCEGGHPFAMAFTNAAELPKTAQTLSIVKVLTRLSMN